MKVPPSKCVLGTTVSKHLAIKPSMLWPHRDPQLLGGPAAAPSDTTYQEPQRFGRPAIPIDAGSQLFARDGALEQVSFKRQEHRLLEVSAKHEISYS